MVIAKIKLSNAQLKNLKKIAKFRKNSVSNIIREDIDKLIKSSNIEKIKELKCRAIAVAGRFRSGVKDLSKDHDKYFLEAINR